MIDFAAIAHAHRPSSVPDEPDNAINLVDVPLDRKLNSSADACTGGETHAGPMNTTTPQAQMLALIEQWAAAELAGDAEAVSVLLTDDFTRSDRRDPGHLMAEG